MALVPHTPGNFTPHRSPVMDPRWTDSGDSDGGYGQIFAVLARRRLWLLGVFGSVVAAAAGLTFITDPVYQSSLQLLVESNYQGREQNGDRASEGQFTDSNVKLDYSTQLQLMKSSQLLQRAVDQLKPTYPDITVGHLKEALVVSQIEDGKTKTKIFEAIYIGDDPEKTQAVLQAVQKVYQDYNREQQELRLSRGLAFINDQLPKVQAEVREAEAALEAFRKNQNLIDPEAQSQTILEALSRTRQEQQTNQAELQATQAQFASLQRQLGRSPQAALLASRLSESTRYQALLNEIQKTEIELAQQRLRFKDASPYVQQVIDKRQRQLALLQQEAQRVLSSTSTGTSSQGDRLLTEGQMGELDLNLAGQLVETQTRLQALQARGRSLSQTEQQLTGELQRFPQLLAEYGRLEPQLQLRRETLQELLKARQELGLEIARGGFDWQVVEEPRTGNQIAPNLQRNLLLGAVAGLMLGAVAAFVREGVDDAVHTSDDLQKQVPLPLLGMIPELPRSVSVAEPTIKLPLRRSETFTTASLEVIHWPPFRESMDLIYQNIQLLNGASPLKSIVVTSALAGEGKSTLAMGLAMSAARLHQRVLLIDADLRRPSLHKQLNLPNDRGLSSLLSGDALFQHGDIQPSGPDSDISVLTAGPTPTDPAKLLSSRRMAELMTMFEQTYDLVVLDAPPVLGMVDAMLAGSFCQGVMLVGRIGQVTRTELGQAAHTLHKLNVIGMIANGATSTAYTPYVGYSAPERLPM